MQGEFRENASDPLRGISFRKRSPWGNYVLDEMYEAMKEGKRKWNDGSTKDQNTDSTLEPRDQHQSQGKMLLRERYGREEAIQKQVTVKELSLP